jgi:hypothetical protein
VHEANVPVVKIKKLTLDIKNVNSAKSSPRTNVLSIKTPKRLFSNALAEVKQPPTTKKKKSNSSRVLERSKDGVYTHKKNEKYSLRPGNQDEYDLLS